MHLKILNLLNNLLFNKSTLFASSKFVLIQKIFFFSVFRLGKSFEVIQSTLQSLHIKDPILRTFVSMAKINNALFLLFDNLIWLDKVGLIKINRARMSEISAKFWLASILCSISRDIYQLWTLIDEEELKENNGPSFIIMCLLKNKPLLFDLIRNAADVPLPMAMLKRTDLSPGSLGLLGIISTYIGILTEWNPDYKVIPS